jgi:hypothetical protein
MSTPRPLHPISVVAAIALAAASAQSLAGQTMSARPASVSLTVVVPAAARVGDALTADGRATVLHRSPTMLDLETTVGAADRAASRIEVRLGAGWADDSVRVLVRNQHGAFEPLVGGASVVAVDAPPSLTSTRSPLQFRLASTKLMPALQEIPVEYRITVGSSDQIAVWSFPARIRVDAPR